MKDAFATVVDEADGSVETNLSRHKQYLRLMPQIVSFTILIGLGDKAQLFEDRLRLPC